jgi:hypothetical protein
MSKKTKKIIITSLVVVIAITAVVGYMMWNKPHKNVKDADAVSISAGELYNRFVTDSAKANAAYVNKVVLVSGEISQVSMNQQSQQIILLKTAVTGASINCTMEEKVADPKAGEKISIKAICSGYISGDADMGLPGDVFLIRGYLSK